MAFAVASASDWILQGLPTTCNCRVSYVLFGFLQQNAQFQKADLRYVDFTGADLSGAALEQCTLEGEKFTPEGPYIRLWK
eukprot:1367560-Amorphochlora_amoeboformis.AAC.1